MLHFGRGVEPQNALLWQFLTLIMVKPLLPRHKSAIHASKLVFGFFAIMKDIKHCLEQFRRKGNSTQDVTVCSECSDVAAASDL
jgi:hypothetical protein